MKLKAKALLDLTKPTLVLMALVTTLLGYFLAEGRITPEFKLWMTLLATVLTYGGSAVLNHYIERDRDSKMFRTQNRPLPLGVIRPGSALVYGLLLIGVGVFLMGFYVNGLACVALAATAVLYVLVYTPLKTKSPLNTLVGSLPGAMPPLIGWMAATGSFQKQALLPFLILFAWQFPHFYAIAWIYREDYARGGFKMFPVVEEKGKWTFRQVLFFTLLLIYFSLIPGLWGYQGVIYIVGVMIMGAVMLALCFEFMLTHSNRDAKRLMRATLFYLPILFLLTVFDPGGGP